MADAPKTSNRSNLVRQARQHLESLQAAGVEFAPAVPPGLVLPLNPGQTDPGAARLLAIPPAAQPVLGSVPTDQAKTAADASLFAGNDLICTTANGPTPDQRRHELKVLGEQVAKCSRCAELVRTRSRTVFGVGPIDADVCFVGEGPGADEDRQGEPFVGAAGQLLNRIIAACGFKREEVYICNIVKCRPPGNRQPTSEEAGNCREFLERQLELVRPRYIVALGATAAQNLLGTTTSIGRLRGLFQDYRGIPVLCTFHPAFLLRSPERKRDVWEDMKKLLHRMGRPIPESTKG